MGGGKTCLNNVPAYTVMATKFPQTLIPKYIVLATNVAPPSSLHYTYYCAVGVLAAVREWGVEEALIFLQPSLTWLMG